MTYSSSGEESTKLESFLKDFNNFHRSVKITRTTHHKSIDYLDVTLTTWTSHWLPGRHIDYLDVTVFKSTPHAKELSRKVQFKATNTDSLQTVYRPFTDSLQTVYRPFTDRLQTVYRPFTDRLLHKHSFHPQHTFKGIVKGQLKRFHRLCTHTKDFKEAVCSNPLHSTSDMNYSERFLQQHKRDFLFGITHQVNISIHRHKIRYTDIR